MQRLSRPIEEIGADYDVVVVGSGYGGAIAACRLARAGRRVCVLERGREFLPGEFPNTAVGTAPEIQIDTPEGHIGRRSALYDFRVNRELNAFVGCGVGGGSLVNANVALRPEPWVLADAVWPQALREDVVGLTSAYQRALGMLAPTPLPADRNPNKLDALEAVGRALDAACERPPITVNFTDFTDGRNAVGVEQPPCNDCGDCVSGCNTGAKNTPAMNYLPDAVRHGAEIFTEARVLRVERDGARWQVVVEALGEARERFGAPAQFVTAYIVVLAAGAFGSTEILLRSKAAGLPLSACVGKRFTSNGDVLGFAFNGDEPVHGVGFGASDPAQHPRVGPCITGLIDRRSGPAGENGMVIEEGVIPGALGAVVYPLLAAYAATRRIPDPVAKAREVESGLLGPYAGAMDNTLTYLVMAHDGSDGELFLDDGRVRVNWPGVGARPIFNRINDDLQKGSAALGADYLPSPIWSPVFRHALMTVHPLGGCAIGEDAVTGVVDDRCRVFASEAGTATHDGLYVCDGAVMPRSLGVNPFLTISAVAERAMDLLAADRGWTIATAPNARLAPSAATAEPIGLQFTETMRGSWTRDSGAPSPLEFTLTIETRNLDAMLADPMHAATLSGTVSAPALDTLPLMARRGQFNLLNRATDGGNAREMRYRIPLQRRDGHRYLLLGVKHIRDDPLFDLWSDTTTLYVDLFDGIDEHGTKLGSGVLHIEPADFAAQLTTMRVNHAPNLAAQLEAMAKFGQFFAGSLFTVYGPVARGRPDFGATTPRARRALRAPTPTTHSLVTDDGRQLRLTRYQGGTKGPVMLSHGLGVSSLIFAIDTIDTNLLEYLVANGYDVWLLDYRASVELPTAQEQFTADEIARFDYPAAVAAVKAATGKDSVLCVAHCFGAMTFSMALLAGLKGVRAAVISQIAAHVSAPPGAQVKAGLHLPDLLQLLHVPSLNARANTDNWFENLYDDALKLGPVPAGEECNSSTCHRIQFMYGLLYQHHQLNPATHGALPEMFGRANVSAFEHLARIIRAGHVVAADGGESYLASLDGMNLPLLFVHGARNACFLPESTQRTQDALAAAFGPEKFQRVVVPDYGHIDCIFGQNAARDVYPAMVEHLDRYA